MGDDRPTLARENVRNAMSTPGDEYPPGILVYNAPDRSMSFSQKESTVIRWWFRCRAAGHQENGRRRHRRYGRAESLSHGYDAGKLLKLDYGLSRQHQEMPATSWGAGRRPHDTGLHGP